MVGDWRPDKIGTGWGIDIGTITMYKAAGNNEETQSPEVYGEEVAQIYQNNQKYFNDTKQYYDALDYRILINTKAKNQKAVIIDGTQYDLTASQEYYLLALIDNNNDIFSRVTVYIDKESYEMKYIAFGFPQADSKILTTLFWFEEKNLKGNSEISLGDDWYVLSWMYT